jgi:rhamnosyltransferase
LQALSIKKDIISIKSFAAQAMVTVIIPTYNTGERFALLLEGLKNQTIKPCQIIVVDSQSMDGTKKLAEKYDCRVFSIDRADFGHGKTRNIAASRACWTYKKPRLSFIYYFY